MNRFEIFFILLILQILSKKTVIKVFCLPVAVFFHYFFCRVYGACSNLHMDFNN